MHIVFYSTNDVFRTEEIFSKHAIVCKIVPTPVQDKAYCGVCIETNDKTGLDLIKEMEHAVIK